MPASLRPSITKNGGKVIGGVGAGGGLLTVLIIYLLNQSGAENKNDATVNRAVNQATIDARQDMGIAQNKIDIAEGKEDRKKILHQLNKMNLVIVRIDEKLGR
jgi:hypothetical protein